jgi:sporulation protein YlmC with PRC-barrel domain
MDIARDILDHRIVDLDGHDVGRVDDVWIELGTSPAVGPLVTGTGALLRHLGRAGRMVAGAAPLVGFQHATRWRELAWADVSSLQRPQLVIKPRKNDMQGRPEGHTPAATCELLYTDLIAMTVIDRNQRKFGVLDARATLPRPQPALLGLIVSHHPRLSSWGLKRFDSTSQHFGGIRRNARYLPVELINARGDNQLHIHVRFEELPRITDAPRAELPPLSDSPHAP